jgi:hypothetical protein
MNADLEAWTISSRAMVVALAALAALAAGARPRQGHLPANRDRSARARATGGRAAAVLLVVAAVLTLGPILIVALGTRESSSSLGFLLELGGSG